MRQFYCAWSFDNETPSRSGPRLIVVFQARWLQPRAFERWIRLRLPAQLPDSELALRRQAVLAVIGSLELVEIDGTVLDRAAQPMPTELGTLDAIHLASALLWRESIGEELMMATHDRALALGAQAHGIPVIGIQ